jgi:predicted MPP superfamily phosphohydrolase
VLLARGAEQRSTTPIALPFELKPMRPITWIHVSDIHMRPADVWSQSVIMRAMCDSIADQRQDCVVDFILVTGDLAYTGDSTEYTLLPEFFDQLAAASGVPPRHIYCVPGNHDINRTRHRFCFRGARKALIEPGAVDRFLGSPDSEDYASLMTRQEAYREFRASYFVGQNRISTPDGLAYVSHLAKEGVHIAIIGLDSSWMAEGGEADHARLLIGERQIINALRLVQQGEHPPHIVVAMGHHPFHLLQNFDRQAAQRLIEQNCHFYHCGHLHQPEARTAGLDPHGCLIVSAGASYQSRNSQNSYTRVTLDVLGSTRITTTYIYEPNTGGFHSQSQEYPIAIHAGTACDIQDLGQAFEDNVDTPWPYYFASLLLDHKTEVLVDVSSEHTMASIQFVQKSPLDTQLAERTVAFLDFAIVLQIYSGRQPLEIIIRDHGVVVKEYSDALQSCCDANAGSRPRLDQQERDARRLAARRPASSFSHTLDLLDDLAGSQEWRLLRHHAGRHRDSANASLAAKAKKLLALALAHSDEVEDREQAITLYGDFVTTDVPESEDILTYVTLLIGECRMDDAKASTLAGISRCSPGAVHQIAELGQRIVVLTGDRSFRREIEGAVARRGTT